MPPLGLVAGHPVFHSVERFFPLCGKIAKKFSIVWKTPALQTVTPCRGPQIMETLP